MKKILLILFIFLFSSSVFAKTQSEEYKNDYLYSAEYFDYLIECAQNDKFDEENNIKDEIKLDEITADYNEEYIEAEYEPFKLHVETTSNIIPWGQTFHQVDTKTIIPVGENFSFVQDMSKTRNKYNSNDYKILAGIQYTPCRFFNIASGFETNFSGLNQVPTSKKIYFTPTVKINDILSLSFINKVNTYTRSTDHDLGIVISPLKSKAFDFRIYAGLTRRQSGKTSESINFTTNFYLF